MEARFNEKVREYHDAIAAACSPAEKQSLETEMYDYMARTAPFIREYHQEAKTESVTKTVANIKITSQKGIQRQDIFNSYLADVEGVHQLSRPCESTKYYTSCINCGAKFSIIFDEVASENICMECGTTEYMQGEEIGFKEEQDMEKHVIYSYKRENHFNEWVSQFQAKESTNVPPDVVSLLRNEFKKQKIKDLSEITHEKVKTLLKKLDKSKYYEHVPYITTILNGIQPPTMTQALEDKLRLMFHHIQKPFEKHKPAKRKNFLSYSYVLYKFCELLGEDDYLPCFPLLKSKEKLYAQDEIWKKICEELQWEYIKTI